MTPVDTANPVDIALAALADPIRRRTVELLARRPHRAGELAGSLGVTRPTMSKHLKTLRDGGLVIVTPPAFDTRVRIYQLRRESFDGLSRWLDRTERGWAEQLDDYSTFVNNDYESR